MFTSRIYIIIVQYAFISISSLFAQNETDALRYSQLFYGGTARGTAIGGATTALGADFSAISINPASLGFNRNSTFIFTPAIVENNASSSYINTNFTAEKYNFNISSWGAILSYTQEGRPWRSVSLGLGSNRLNNYNKSTYYSAFNNENSFLDSYLETVNANGGTAPEDMSFIEPFGTSLAWETFLINPVDPTLSGEEPQEYNSVIPNGGITQTRSMISRGAMDDYFIAVGANYYDKLYMGASFNFPVLRYREESSYTESDNEETINGFDQYTYTQTLNTNGRGAAFKVGLIYKVEEWLRIGGSIHTPTYFNMNERYSSDVVSILEDSTGTTQYNAQSPDGIFNYSLLTPWRVNTGISIVLQELGFLTFDYEYVDYRAPRYNFNATDAETQQIEVDINQTIDEVYTAAHNFRIGAEAKAEKFRFRGGYAFYGNSFSKEINFNNSKNVFSTGVGYVGESVFIDLTYSRAYSKSFFQMYTLNYPNEINYGANQKTTGNNFLLTFGINF